MFQKIIIVVVSWLLIGSAMPSYITTIDEIVSTSIDMHSLSVTIHILPCTLLYEGDVVNCTITGNPETKYWQINGQSQHTTFSGNNPVLFNPEPTPLNETYVTLIVTVENGSEIASDSVLIQLQHLFFGDLHFHSEISDGYYTPETLYQNAINDNYLDFVCLTDHGELINQIDITPPQPIWMWTRSLIQVFMYKFLDRDEWSLLKENVIRFYNPGNFTTLLGFEYSSGPWFPGGSPLSTNGHDDVSHICFIYRDVYKDVQKYSAWNLLTFDDLFVAMNNEWENGHLNVGFTHHPLMRIFWYGDYTVNWSYFANKITNTKARDQVFRGVETYSRWGTAIGKYSGIPIKWPYAALSIRDKPEYWVENALWEWSKDARKNLRFVLEASSDTHGIDRPGSAQTQNERISKSNPSGIVAAYATHNTRTEIWDALNNCSIYGLQALKIRANVRFDGQIALGRWINCTAPLKIAISVQSTFPGLDSNGRSMCPDGYDPNELDYPIEDIWLIKKDTNRGQPWCKVIGHISPNTSLAVVEFQDPDVQPNDFYYIAIRQKGDCLTDDETLDSDETNDEYMAFLGPVFIDQVGP